MLVCIFSIHERWRSIKDIHKNTKKQKNNGQNKCQNKYAEDQQAKKILTLVKYTPPQNDDLWLTTNIAAPVLHRRLSEILGRAGNTSSMRTHCTWEFALAALTTEFASILSKTAKQKNAFVFWGRTEGMGQNNIIVKMYLMVHLFIWI